MYNYSVTYAFAVNKIMPDAIQISDRIHLMKNFIEVSKEYINANVLDRFINECDDLGVKEIISF